MIIKGLLLAVFSLIFLGGSAQYHQKPVNPNASPEAKQLLNYLYSLQGKKILSGQHNYAHRYKDLPYGVNFYTDTAFKITGKYPAVWGCDFSYTQMVVEKRQCLINEAVKNHQEGFVVTLMYHQVRPMDIENNPDSILHQVWKNSVQGELTNKEWEEFLTPGTVLNKMWLEKIDTVAYFLKYLRDANVPVLWRPYHEMNGAWFWWGDHRGDDGYIKLWKAMYDRYVNHHQLNNLIWVWNANSPRNRKNDTAYAYHHYFPGVEYVDVLAADIYHNDYKQSHHDELLELGKGKLIALGEVGQMPTPRILEKQPMWSWFMTWSNFLWKANTTDAVLELYNCERVLTKEQLNIVMP